MFFPARRGSVAPLAALLAFVTACGIGGDSRDIPPAPTAAPGSAEIFLYVAEATDPTLGTAGGAVSLYQVGADGFLPGGPPLRSVPAVNPRRLVKHPTLDVLYVLTLNQVLAFDVSGGALISLCGGSGAALAPPCATSPRQDADPIDMTVEQSQDGGFVLYVVERGSGNQLSQISAYSLDADGGLPSFPASQARTVDTFFYLGFAVAGSDGAGYFGFAADPNRSGYDRFPLMADGNFLDPAPTPSPPGAPTPEATPTSEASPTPSPNFYFLDDIGPGKTIKVPVPQPSPDGSVGVFYVMEQGQSRIGQLALDSAANLPDQPNTQSVTRGLYNEILVAPSVSRVYGAGFQIGQVDSFLIGPDGSIDRNSLASTFANTAQFPTGIAYVEQTVTGGTLRRTLFVSLGGFNRVDAYEVNADGTLADRPFSSTEARNDTFPSDVLVLAVE